MELLSLRITVFIHTGKEGNAYITTRDTTTINHKTLIGIRNRLVGEYHDDPGENGVSEGMKSCLAIKFVGGFICFLYKMLDLILV